MIKKVPTQEEMIEESRRRNAKRKLQMGDQMERRNEFIRRQEQEKRKDRSTAAQENAAKEYFEAKAAAEAESAQRAKERRIQKAAAQVEGQEKTVAEFEAMAADAAALLTKLEGMEAKLTAIHQAAIKAAGMGFPDARRDAINITVMNQKTVLDAITRQAKDERGRLEEIYKTLLDAGKLQAEPTPKKKGLFK